jgi:hypothetical protein
MRAMAISIVVLAGAIMAAAGTVAESLPGSRRLSDVDEWGLGFAVVGALLLIGELRNWRPFQISNSQLRDEPRPPA